MRRYKNTLAWSNETGVAEGVGCATIVNERNGTTASRWIDRKAAVCRDAVLFL
ncbi:MAG: hypothetical protein ACK40X_15120 [Armatimonadota bacterium]